ncbi:nucleotide-diphospho-sugar transferase [Dipodascopsis tothii]|uniref:nucleotide-diphospho-sugar transferase n=1 Tax=Dipodascopsis tothii TaxID=44089 RepID=UPI0034CF49BE
MRRRFAVPLLALGAFVVVGVYVTFTYITLLFDSVSDNSIDFVSGADHKLTNANGRDHEHTQVIPKIIHQTWVNDSVPTKWLSAQQSCLDVNPDWEYHLWTDNSSRQFIAEEYPWFLETFDKYPYPIMRADVIRYFVLAHYGGIYIDLDEGCSASLEPLLNYPAWVRKADPTGISNSVMGSTRNHPFFLRVLLELKKYTIDWQVPYITVMYATGPLFLSVVWKQYKHWATNHAEQVWILMPNDAENDSTFFFDLHGSSWHEDDAKWIMYLGVHWLFFTIIGFVVAAVIGLSAYLILKRSGRNKQFKKLKILEEP